MRVAFLTAGAAGMICGSCLNDNTLARSLALVGVDVVLLPTYTPIRTDEVDVSERKIFFGGINVFLQQKYAFFRKTPWFLDKLFNLGPLLKLTARMSGSTDARLLGEMTIAVLQGADGPLKKELAKLIDWLKCDFKPDLVHLTNAMFVGLAQPLKQALGVAVTCGLPGEDLFLDALTDPYKSMAHTCLKMGASDVDAFTAPSAYYRQHMSNFLNVPLTQIHLLPMGLNFQAPSLVSERGSGPFTIGFLARCAPEKGLHLLVDAFIQLSQQQDIRLRVAGFLAQKDKVYFTEQVTKIEDAGLSAQVDWQGEVDGPGKHAFFQGLHAFSMPAPYREPKGRSVLEAMANGVPVVQPKHGAFPEMLAQSGGGLLVAPNDVSALAAGLGQLMEQEPLRLELARTGRERVRAHHTAEAMAVSARDLWQQILDVPRCKF